MSTQQTSQEPISREPAQPDPYYCNCAIPLAVERAERHGAAWRVCTRCELPIAVSTRRW